MDDCKLFEGEYKLASIVWELEPVASPDLARACEERLGWKKSTTYTVLKRLGDRGVLHNERSVVTALVKREAVCRYETEAVLNRSFGGSLPAFVACFLEGRRITGAEAEEIRRMIEEASR